MEQIMVERDIWIDAPVEQVWRALAEPAELAQWLLPPALGAQLVLGGDGRLLVDMGGMQIALARLELAEPEQRISYRSLPDQIFATEYRLARERGGTRVRVALEGFDRLPAADRHDRVASSGGAWERALQNLRAHVAGGELPFPEGYVAALFGYRRESQQRFAVERSILIGVGRERVWQALTDPAQIERWFSPGTSWRLTVLAPGGRLFAPDPETGEERYTQIVEVVEPPQRFVLRTPAEPSGRSEVTTYALREEPGGTRLTILHSGYEWLAEDSRWAMMEQNSAGFGMMLENLRMFAEGAELPYPAGL